MNPDQTLNEGVMNEQSLLKLLWEVPYKNSRVNIGNTNSRSLMYG